MFGMHEFAVLMEVAAVRRPILSAAKLQDRGFAVGFGSQERGARRGAVYLPFRREGGLFLLRGRVQRLLREGARVQQQIMPFEEEHPLGDESPVVVATPAEPTHQERSSLLLVSFLCHGARA